MTTVHTVKGKGKISQNFVAFSEYVNFKWPRICFGSMALRNFCNKIGFSQSQFWISIIHEYFDFDQSYIKPFIFYFLSLINGDQYMIKCAKSNLREGWCFDLFKFWLRLDPHWHELWKQEKCSSLAPPRGFFYKTQWAWQGVKFTQLMSIFTSQKSLEIFYINSADKVESMCNGVVLLILTDHFQYIAKNQEF